jgi:hypothetical protein
MQEREGPRYPPLEPYLASIILASDAGTWVHSSQGSCVDNKTHIKVCLGVLALCNDPEGLYNHEVLHSEEVKEIIFIYNHRHVIEHWNDHAVTPLEPASKTV